MNRRRQKTRQNGQRPSGLACVDLNDDIFGKLGRFQFDANEPTAKLQIQCDLEKRCM